MTVQIRKAILAMAAYKPPIAGRTGLRLDFNENTSGCSPSVLRALAGMDGETLARYPDVAAAEAAIAAAYGHTSASALLTNGVDDALLLLALTVLEAGTEAIVSEPCFAMYRFYAAQLGARTVAVPFRRSPRQFVTDCAALDRAVTPRTRVIFLASPNNPTGHLTPAADLLALAQRWPDILICVDEAYAEFVADDATGMLPYVLRQPNLVVTRTFSKAYGLAGARLGCLFAHPELLPVLRKAHSPYNVSTLAAACGAAAVADSAWVRAYRREVIASRGLVESALDELAIPYWRSAANFVLCDAGTRALELTSGLRARGVLVRDRGGDIRGAVRITCGRVSHTEAACVAIKEVWRG
ncbi:MAG TPA: histidinol-phosphate transaminase [Terriglobales bacterium]|nr:histidinol-phosphate transaminase [Terriglobales bacterium]